MGGEGRLAPNKTKKNNSVYQCCIFLDSAFLIFCLLGT